MPAKAASQPAAIRPDPAVPEGKPGALRQFMRDLRAGRPSLRPDTTGLSLMLSAVQEVEPLFEAADAISPDLVEASEVLPAGDAVLGVVDLIGSAAAKVKAWRRVSASEPGYRRAVVLLARSRLPEEIERRKASLKATRHWIRACLGAAAGHDGTRVPTLAAHRMRQDGAAHLPDTFRRAMTAGDPGAAALGKAAMSVINRELAVIDQQRDTILRQHGAALLEHDTVALDDRRASRRLRGSVVACARDSGLQGLRVGYEASPLADSAWEGPLDLGLIPGDVFSFGLGAAIGLAHVGCGIGELAEAKRRGEAVREIGQAVGDNLRRLSADPARGARLKSPAAAEALRWFADGQRRWRQRAGELARWAIGRIAYGIGTVLLSGAGMAAVAVVGTAVLASPVGTALVLVGGVLGGVWFLFTLTRIAMRFVRGLADKRERERLADAVRRGATRGLCADTLSRCSLEELESLRRDCPALSGNRYWQAALLTRRLLIDHSADKTAGKASRLETSALLQALGMPKLATTLLKHAGFELAYRTIFLHLQGDGVLAAWCDGTFHRAQTADARRSPAQGR